MKQLLREARVRLYVAWHALCGHSIGFRIDSYDGFEPRKGARFVIYYECTSRGHRGLGRAIESLETAISLEFEPDPVDRDRIRACLNDAYRRLKEPR